jgi:hypothetical protein
MTDDFDDLIYESDAECEADVSDARPIHGSLRKPWPMPDDRLREGLVNRQVFIGVNPKIPCREATAAFRALLTAESQNFAAEKIAAAIAPSTTVNLNVGILAQPPDRRRLFLAALAERIGAGSLDSGEGFAEQAPDPPPETGGLPDTEGAGGGQSP